MANLPCNNCGKLVEQTPGRRLKKFCSAKCRQEKWQKDQRELRAHVKELGTGYLVKSANPTTVTYTAPPINMFDAFKTDILNTTYSGDLQKVMKDIESNTELGAIGKAKLRAIADEHRLNFTN